MSFRVIFVPPNQNYKRTANQIKSVRPSLPVRPALRTCMGFVPAVETIFKPDVCTSRYKHRKTDAAFKINGFVSDETNISYRAERDSRIQRCESFAWNDASNSHNGMRVSRIRRCASFA